VGACPNCGSERVAEIGEIPVPVECSSSESTHVQAYVRGLTPSILCVCESCQLRFRSQQPESRALQEFYSNLRATNWDYVPTTVGSWCCAKKYLSRQYEFSSGVRVLDVGAFNGAFLASLPSGWVKCAVEPNPGGVSQFKALGIIHIGDFLDDVRLRSHHHSFDVVTMFDVFEHLLDPDKSMSMLIALLKPGGRLLISTGNADHWTWRLLKTQHWYLHTIQHLCVGSQKYFSRYCKENGLLLECSLNHSHRVSSLGARLNHSVETLHWWLRGQQGLSRKVAGVIQWCPGFRSLVHRTSTPFANSLADHSLFVIRKPLES
jgi:SAM-dependent methyltransferase